MSAEQKNDVRKLGILCLVVLSGNRLRQSARKGVLLLLIACLALLQTGCLTTDVTPMVSAQTAENGTVTTKAGISIGASEFHGGFWRETGQTVFGPFHVYRAADKKWFPEWREHPWRTSGMTVLYGGIAALCGGSGGGSGASQNQDQNPPSDGGDGHSKPEPKPNPTDHGESGGGDL